MTNGCWRAPAWLAAAAWLTVLCCTSRPKPESVQRPEPAEPYRASLKVSSNIPYDSVWVITVFTLAKEYELAVLDKEAGYVKTERVGEWTSLASSGLSYGGATVVVVFAPDRRHLFVTAKSSMEMDIGENRFRVRVDEEGMARSVRDSLAAALGIPDVRQDDKGSEDMDNLEETPGSSLIPNAPPEEAPGSAYQALLHPGLSPASEGAFADAVLKMLARDQRIRDLKRNGRWRGP